MARYSKRKRSRSRKFRGRKGYKKSAKKSRKTSKRAQTRARTAIKVRGISKRISMKPEMKMYNYFRANQPSSYLAEMVYPTVSATTTPTIWALNGSDNQTPIAKAYFLPFQGYGVDAVIGEQFVCKYVDLRFMVGINPQILDLNLDYATTCNDAYRLMIISPKNNNNLKLNVSGAEYLESGFYDEIDRKQFVVHYDKVFPCPIPGNMNAGLNYYAPANSTGPWFFRFIIPVRQMMEQAAPNPPAYIFQQDIKCFILKRNSNKNIVVQNIHARLFYQDP